MTRYKQKSRGDTHQTHSKDVKTKGIVDYGVIEVNRFKATVFAEPIAATGCSMRMMHSKNTWQGLITHVPEIDSAMTFLTKYCFIAGFNNSLVRVLHGSLMKPRDEKLEYLVL